MNDSKLMKERIRRVRVLFKELGYEIYDSQRTRTIPPLRDEKVPGGVLIDKESKFLELAFTFSFSSRGYLHHNEMKRCSDLLRIRLLHQSRKPRRRSTLDLLQDLLCRLNYFSLKETVRDFKEWSRAQDPWN
jgi:hypothetical protein